MLVLDKTHPLSVKFQNAAFSVEDRFDWESPSGKVPALSISSVWASKGFNSKFFAKKLGFDVQQSFIVHAVTHELLSN